MKNFFSIIITVPPLTVSIEVDNSKRPLVAGKEAKVECKCKGSRPTPLFRWFVGSRELDTSSKNDKMAEEHHETAGGEWTSSIIRFLPKAEDNGKTILCKVTNEYFPDITKEDSLILNIHCKYTMPNNYRNLKFKRERKKMSFSSSFSTLFKRKCFT